MAEKPTLTSLPADARRELQEQASSGSERARARAGASRRELYELAKRRRIPGRSSMGKAELAKALGMHS